ncbi:hemerythrin/HHE cation-binding domain-containing protein [Variovorax paradoxus B4]|uniref:Hemerythrin/HHE cation-binding domain-containing protein n=1 Tax=Variovorax paradoxus B4 TaxID=1246301 RepID=T1X6J3_VARPD|nr:hemerythrin domain-containing protein [Variovorax paradoxus]AGU48183.1 hemerythrin/HHE cation-binding domain-containing protein [Variovorax paradoxus B4]
MPPRFDLYTPIHKALRAALFHTQGQLGQTDWCRPSDRQATLEDAQALLQLMRAHLGHENDFVHPAMETALPGSSRDVADDHRTHAHDIASLEADVSALRAAPTERAGALGLALYRRFSAFVAHNLTHMLVEEEAHNALLWASLDDTALIALHDRLVASIPPQDMLASLRWMAKGLSVPELAELLNGLRDNPPVFQTALDEMRRWLDAPREARLCGALGLAPVHDLIPA